MTGRPAGRRTRAREAYFLELAQDVAAAGPLSLMFTGEVVRRSVSEKRPRQRS